MKKILFLSMISASCFANVIDYDSSTGQYRLDQFGSAMSSSVNKFDSSFYAPSQQGLNGDSERGKNYMKQSLREMNK